MGWLSRIDELWGWSREPKHAPPLGVRYFGIELPTAVRSFQPDEHTVRYVVPPSSSLDWQGSDWAHSTSLEFKTHVMNSQKIGINVAVPLDPEGFVREVTGKVPAAVRDTRAFLRSHDQVIDTEGLSVECEWDRGWNMVRITGKAWPALAGVTTESKDTTL